MIRQGLLILALAAVSMSLFGAEGDQNDSMHLSLEAGLMVFDRQVASDIIGEWADENGGYFVWKSDERVVFRVPDDKAEGFRAFVEEISDGIINFGRTTVDLRQEILRASSALEAREEILQRNLELLDSSDVEGTLALEKEIRRLMSEIDASHGRLRKLENDAGMASVVVNLSFRSQTLPDRRPSNFAWINAVDFYNLISGYRMSGSKRIFGEPMDMPEGFARVDDKKGFTGISPEGVRFRMVRLENYPEQGSEFWRNTLENDLKERGYILMPEESTIPVFDESRPFEKLLWGMPVGEEDYLYLVGLRVSGKNIEFLEMAGSAKLMQAYLK